MHTGRGNVGNVKVGAVDARITAQKSATIHAAAGATAGAAEPGAAAISARRDAAASSTEAGAAASDTGTRTTASDTGNGAAADSTGASAADTSAETDAGFAEVTDGVRLVGRPTSLGNKNNKTREKRTGYNKYTGNTDIAKEAQHIRFEIRTERHDMT